SSNACATRTWTRCWTTTTSKTSKRPSRAVALFEVRQHGIGELPRRLPRVAAEELDQEHRAPKVDVLLDLFAHALRAACDGERACRVPHVAAEDLLRRIDHGSGGSLIGRDRDQALLADGERR